jgi:hypothetical protein
VFIDRDPVEPGAVIPVEAGVIHTTDDPIVIPGFHVGPHVITVIFGDGTHRRIGSQAAVTSFSVAGPSVDASAPPNVLAGQSVTVTVAQEGLADDASLYVFVDRDPSPAGEPVPEDPGIIHFTGAAAAIPELTPGAHFAWVVAADAAGLPLDPPVMDRIAVTVG